MECCPGGWGCEGSHPLWARGFKGHMHKVLTAPAACPSANGASGSHQNERQLSVLLQNIRDFRLGGKGEVQRDRCEQVWSHIPLCAGGIHAWARGWFLEGKDKRQQQGASLDAGPANGDMHFSSLASFLPSNAFLLYSVLRTMDIFTRKTISLPLRKKERERKGRHVLEPGPRYRALGIWGSTETARRELSSARGWRPHPPSQIKAPRAPGAQAQTLSSALVHMARMCAVVWKLSW